MSYRIFRYPLRLVDYQEIEVGWPAHLLSVALSRSDLNGFDLWAQVADRTDRENLQREMPIPGRPVPATVTVPIFVVGTGHPMPTKGVFLGTVIMGDYVWHIWTGEQQ
jgi:hypothetical protein